MIVNEFYTYTYLDPENLTNIYMINTKDFETIKNELREKIK